MQSHCVRHDARGGGRAAWGRSWAKPWSRKDQPDAGVADAVGSARMWSGEGNRNALSKQQKLGNFVLSPFSWKPPKRPPEFLTEKRFEPNLFERELDNGTDCKPVQSLWGIGLGWNYGASE